MKFSAIFRPTTLFSLKDSNCTSSGAKSLFLPSPYAIKMAFLNQAISLSGENFSGNINHFEIIRDAEISYFIKGSFCVNNCLIKIQKQRDNDPFKSTVSFREYVFLGFDLELIFQVNNSDDASFLKKHLYKINYFGKRGCFFQFIKFSTTPSEPNVKVFDINEFPLGVLQQYDDFDKNLSFDNVNNYCDAKTSRKKVILVLPIVCTSSSKSYTSYKCL